jgi:transcriptional antiterminator NusG
VSDYDSASGRDRSSDPVDVAARLLGASEVEADEIAEAEARADDVGFAGPATDAGTDLIGEPEAAAELPGDSTGPAAEAAEQEPAADVDEDEDPVEVLRRELRTQFGDWYVVHSYAGYEN